MPRCRPLPHFLFQTSISLSLSVSLSLSLCASSSSSADSSCSYSSTAIPNPKIGAGVSRRHHCPENRPAQAPLCCMPHAPLASPCSSCVPGKKECTHIFLSFFLSSLPLSSHSPSPPLWCVQTCWGPTSGGTRASTCGLVCGLANLKKVALALQGSKNRFPRTHLGDKLRL